MYSSLVEFLSSWTRLWSKNIINFCLPFETDILNIYDFELFLSSAITPLKVEQINGEVSLRESKLESLPEFSFNGKYLATSCSRLIHPYMRGQLHILEPIT